MVISECKVCGVEIVRGGSRKGKTCSRACAAELRRRWKPVSKEWLEEKYLKEGLGTVQIGRLVNRHPKRVYEWLVGFGIPLREKWAGNVPPAQPYHDKAWLEKEYVRDGRTLADIARECHCQPLTVLKYLNQHGIKARTPHESKVLAGTVPDLRGPRNGMYGRRGPRSSNWKGGCTPERQTLYNSLEWAEAVKTVWKRDKATCQRCGRKKRRKDEAFCIHHIVSFAVAHLRTVLSNLLLLCDECHNWVHSRANANRDFIRDYDGRSESDSG